MSPVTENISRVKPTVQNVTTVRGVPPVQRQRSQQSGSQEGRGGHPLVVRPVNAFGASGDPARSSEGRELCCLSLSANDVTPQIQPSIVTPRSHVCVDWTSVYGMGEQADTRRGYSTTKAMHGHHSMRISRESPEHPPRVVNSFKSRPTEEDRRTMCLIRNPKYIYLGV